MIKRMKNQNPEKSLNETHKHHWTKINSKKSNAEWNFKKGLKYFQKRKLDVQCPMTEVRSLMSDVWFPISDV